MKNFLLDNYLILMFVLLTTISFFLSVYTLPVQEHNTVEFMNGFLFLKSVIIYVISLEILKKSLSSWNENTKIKFNQKDYTNSEMKILSVFSAFPFGLGVTSFFKGISKNNINTLPISQGLAISILLYPTTPASGYILDFYQIENMYEIFLYGLPIALLMLLSFKNLSMKHLLNTQFLVLIVLMGVVNFIYIEIISIWIKGHFLIKESFFYILLSFYINRNIFKDFLPIIINTKGEILFFMGIGTLGNTLIIWSELNSVSYNEFLLISNLVLIVPIVILPVLSVLLIPPFVLFIIFSPYITELMIINNFSDIAIYSTWMIMLVNAQLISPVSLTTIMAAKNSDNNIFTESVLKHYKFCIKLSLISFIYLVVIK